MRIVIDAGHGGKDPGATASNFNLREKDLTLTLALRIGQLLKAYGVEVIYTRMDDTFVELSDRAVIANKAAADYFLSCHINAGGGSGFESFVYPGVTGATANYQSVIHGQIAALYLQAGVPDRGKKQSNLAVLRETNMPAILLEYGFIDNAKDAAMLANSTWIENLAQATCAGLVAFLGLKNAMEHPNSNGKIVYERIIAKNGKLDYLPYGSNQPGTNVYFLKLDRGKTRFKFVAKPNGKVSDIVKEYRADYGINFPFFDNQAKLPIGTVWDGTKYVNGAWGKATKWHYLAAKDGIATIGKPDNLERFDFAVQGSPLLVNGGRAVWDYYREVEETATDIGRDANGNLIRCQRTFVGIDAAGNLLIAVSDGRTKSDQGLTLEEMALYMLDKGAVVAINGDGGSSSIIADKNGGFNQTENGGKNERVTHHALLAFCAEDKPEKPNEPVKDWKQESVEWLHVQGLTDNVRDPGTLPTWAELGAVLKKFSSK